MGSVADRAVIGDDEMDLGDLPSVFASPIEGRTYASGPARGAKDPRRDAVAIKKYGRRHPRGMAEMAYAMDNVAAQPYIGYDNRLSIGTSDPELDKLLGMTGLEGADPSAVRVDREQVNALESLFLNANRPIDFDFALEHMEDLHLFVDDPDTLAYIGEIAAWEKAVGAVEDRSVEARVAATDRFVEMFEISRQEANHRFQSLINLQNQVMLELEGMSDEEVIQTMEGPSNTLTELADEMRAGYEGGEEAREAQVQNFRWQLYNKRMTELTDEAFGETVGGDEFWKTWQGEADGLFGAAQAAMGFVAGFIMKGAEAGGWLMEHGALGPFQPAADFWFNQMKERKDSGVGRYAVSASEEARQETLNELRFTAGRDQEELVKEIASESIFAAWQTMKYEDPETWADWVNAGGGETAGRAMFADMVQNVEIERQYGGFTTLRQDAQEASETLIKEVHKQITVLEDYNYSPSDAIMDVLTVWGEFTNDIATGATVVGKQFFGSVDDLFSMGAANDEKGLSFAEEFAKGTPSAVLGIEGTLLGLGFDLGMNALADPMTWIFAPSLAGAGRHGAVTPELARAMVESPVQSMGRQTVIEMLRSTTRGALGVATVLDNLGNSGVAARYIAAAKGFTHPVAARWAPLKKWGTLATDVYVPTLAKLLPEGSIDDVARATAREALEAGTNAPVVISMNPSTGAYRITEGADFVRAAEGQFDNIKVTVKVDKNLAPDIEWNPNMSADDISRIEEIAVASPEDLATKDGKGQPLLQTDEMNRMQAIEDITPAGRRLPSTAVGAAETRGGQVLKIRKMTGDEGDAVRYWAETTDGEVVAAISSSSGGGGGIGILPQYEGHGIMGQIMDTALEMGDDLLVNLSRDAQISLDGAEWLITQAQRRIENSRGAALPTAPWANFDNLERMRKLDGTDDLYVNPKHVLPEEDLFGYTPDYDLLKELEFEHINNGGQPMHGRGMAMSISIGQALGEHLQRFGVTKQLMQWMTPMNNSAVLRLNGPNSFSRLNNFAARLWGAVGDMDNLELYLTRIVDDFAERGRLELASRRLTFDQELIGIQIDNLLPGQRPLINADGTVQRFGVLDDTPIPVDDAAAQAAGFLDLEDYFQREFAKHGVKWELDIPQAEPRFEPRPQQKELFPDPDVPQGDLPDTVRAAEPAPIQSQYREAASRLEGLRRQTDFQMRQKYQVDPMHRGAIETRKEIRALEEKRIELRREQDNINRQMNDYSTTQAIVREMEAEFNRLYIRTNKKWDDIASDENGLVPVDKIVDRSVETPEMLETVLRKASEDNITALEAARQLDVDIPRGMEDTLKLFDQATDADLGRFLTDLLGSSRALSSVQLSMSPLEMIAAAVTTPEALAKIGRMKATEMARAGLHAAHTLWMVDKVLTPRTGIVVALDELMRIWQKGGMRSVGLWLEDRAITMARYVSRMAGDPTYSALPGRWQRRINALKEVPDYYRDVQRSILELHGYGIDTLEFKKGSFASNADYYAAAQQTAQNLVRDPGFHAFLKGEAEFRNWFLSDSNASMLRNIDYWDGATFSRRGMPQWKDVYDGYHSVFEYATNKLDWKRKDMAREAYKEAAERATTKQAAGPMPEWVLEGFGEVTGAARVPKNNIARPVDWISEHAFQRPMNYRQGFLAEMVRKAEWARLEKLYRSRNMQIVTDEELVRRLSTRYPTIPDEILRGGLDFAADDIARRFGMVSRRRLDDMVEQVVETEIEQTLYAFHRQSQLGRHTRALFPFGRPWADMWGHWGREMITRPQLRGWINESNFLNLRNIGEGLIDTLPVNPKTAGFVSRVADVNMDLENIQDDPLFGGAAEALGIGPVDAGGMMFLPNRGESPFLSLIPGFGIVPTMVGERLITNAAPDPETDPQGYQLHMQEASQYFPGVGFNRPQNSAGALYDTAFGGGVVNRFFDLFDSLAMATGQAEYSIKNTFTQDYKTSTAHARATKVLFSNPEIWKELAELDDNFAGIGLQALLNETLADAQTETSQQVGRQRVTESLIELGLPVAVDTLTQSEDLQDLWITSMEYLPLPEDFRKRFNLATDKGKEEAAEAVATFFYQEMTRDEQDLIIVEHPEMVANLVSMWTWTDEGIDQGIEGTDFPYKSTGSTKGKSRHKTYIQMGWIQPASPRQIAINMIGTVADTHQRVSARFYEEAAKMVNLQRWEHLVPQEWKDWAEQEAAVMRESGNMPFENGFELWRNFNVYADLLWEMQGRPLKDDGTPNKHHIPAGKNGFQPWGETLPHNRDRLRDEFEEGFGLPAVNDELLAMAKALGMEVAPGTEMSEIYQQVANYRADQYTENAAFTTFHAAYRAWQAPKGSESQSVWEILGKVSDHELVSPEARRWITQGQLWIDTAMQMRSNRDPGWIQARDQAAEFWEALKYDDYMNKLELDDMWNAAFGNTLGSLDWAPDEPAPLRDESGNLVSTAQVVLPTQIYDGDTIHFQTSSDHSMFGPLGGPEVLAEEYSVRMLGVNAREMGAEGGDEDRQLLVDAIWEAVDNNVPIYIVRDPERYGNTDFYGRVFAWVYIGDEPFHRPETQMPRR